MNKIIHWSSDVTFRTREQANRVIKKLMKEEIMFDFSLHKDTESNRDVWILQINDMPWAENLKTFAKILVSEDEHYE